MILAPELGQGEDLALAASQSTLRFGDYDVETLLGPGSVTETYRACRKGGTAVALKLLRPDRGGTDPKVRRAFVEIAKRNQALRSAGVARVAEVVEGPEDVFAVSELLDGVDLERLFESATASGSMDPALVGQLGVQIARILTRLHERREPILHGGLCPGNVVVTAGGRVTLVDPGFSAVLRPLTEQAIDRSWFVAPEILLGGEPPSVASDLYGLGAVLYYLLTGEPPVMGETLEELSELFEEGVPVVPGIPDWLEEALLTLLARDPADRPRSASAAALLLSPFPDGATRLGAIVNGKAPVPVLPLEASDSGALSAFDPMASHGTMILQASDAEAVRSAPSSSMLEAVRSSGGTYLGLAPDLSTDEAPSPFDAPDSGPLLRPALEDASKDEVIEPPSAVARAKGTPPLTPLRTLAPAGAPEAEPSAAASFAPLDVPGAGAGSGLGLQNEPQWVEGTGVSSTLTLDPRWPVAASPVALQNEPQWADGGSLLGVPAKGYSLPVDEFLDIGAPAPAAVLGTVLGTASGRVELPELLDVDLEAGLAPTATDRRAGADDAPSGLVSFGQMRAEGVAIGAIGVEGEDDEGEGGSPARRTITMTGIGVLPGARRAGSARIGGAKSSGSWLPKMILGVFLLIFGGVVAVKALSSGPMQALPSAEELAKKAPDDKALAPKPVEQQPEEAAAMRGQLTIVTTPRGATVWVDGKERGRTPLTTQTTPGAHRIVIVKPGFKMLREVTDTSEGLTIKRTLPPANINFGGTVALKVECKTEGKYPVFIDGKDTGLLCPIDSLKIPEGNRLVGLYVIPENKIWSFEREVVRGTKAHRVVFSY